MCIRDRKKIGLSDSSDMHRKRLVHSYPVAPTDTFHIRRVLFEGIDPRDEKWLTQISGLKENSLLTVKKLQEAMSIVIGTNLYSNVSYKLVGERQEDLVLTVQEKSNSAINVGLNFNSEDIDVYKRQI